MTLSNRNCLLAPSNEALSMFTTNALVFIMPFLKLSSSTDPCTFATDRESATLFVFNIRLASSSNRSIECFVFIFIFPFSIINFSRLIKLLMPASEFTMGFLLFGFSAPEG